MYAIVKTGLCRDQRHSTALGKGGRDKLTSKAVKLLQAQFGLQDCIRDTLKLELAEHPMGSLLET